jgi:HEPN domain-containing protein
MLGNAKRGWYPEAKTAGGGGGSGVNRADFQKLANDRIADAKALLAAKRWAAAYYLAGYAVECALKACIAKLMKAEEFPDKSFADKCWTHNLIQLLGLAGLKDDFDAAKQADPELSGNWVTVKDWDESSRYLRSLKREAEELVAAITDKTHGVLSWIKLRW